MVKTYKRCNVMSSENDNIFWRRVELTDLPKLKEMAKVEWCKITFGFSEITRIITDNTLSLCQVDCNNEISIFLSLSGRPNVKCIPSEHWTEWFNYFYDLNNVHESNTLFVHVFLYQCVKSLIYLPSLFEMIYVEMPEIMNILFIKVPGTELCAELCSPFSTLSAKNVICDKQFGCPEILYHTKGSSINKICLRTAEVDDFIPLRENLGHRLDFLDDFYGEYSLVKILEDPGEGRINFVPIQNFIVNGLVTITTSVDYSLLDSIFDLYHYIGIIEFVQNAGKGRPKGILRSAGEFKTAETKATNSSVPTVIQPQLDYKNENTKLFLTNDHNNQDYQRRNFVDSSLIDIPMKKRDSGFKDNIIKDFFKFQDKKSKNDKDSYYQNNKPDKLLNHSKLNYQKTAFMIELMLIEKNDENKASWDYLVAYFQKFPEYDYCLISIQTAATPPDYKKFFCRAILKPNCNYSMGLLYVLHRSSILGNFNCILATKEHLEIMEELIKDHPFKNVISNNITKSIFEDTRYKTYIFQCYNQSIGYCVIRLNDEIQFLSSNFDVARYIYPDHARNNMAVLLNMDLQKIFLKNVRCFLKYVMDDGDINCLFYKFYIDSTVMEQCELCCITGMKELIPIKPRVRIQYDDDNIISDDYERFSLFHMNLRLCTIRKNSIDAKIIVIGASVVALSFLESLAFNPVNYYISFENIVLISDCGIPYRDKLTDLEDCMIPKTAHYNYEYMKSIGLNTFVDVIIGSVTSINRYNKNVTVNYNLVYYYDYLFMFNGEQFTFIAEEKTTKSHKNQDKIRTSKNSIFEGSYNENGTIENLFLLNSESDVVNAFNYIETMRLNEKDIVVYGKYLGSLSVINVLLECNIIGSRIVYLESDAKENLPFISSQFIMRSVYEELHERGVHVHKHCKFESYKLNKSRKKIHEVLFVSNEKRLKINCAGMFWFDQKYINKINWLNVLRSSFKFDGHLMVNALFETNVECVYAAGSIAKFTNNNLIVSPNHIYYNSVEIGSRVANVLMKLFNVIEDDRINADYVQPLSVRCRLPGNYNYLHCVVPAMGSELKTGLNDTMKTGDPAQGYFEIVTDENENVLELSCYSKRDLKCSNFINLCGKNVNLFNDILGRLSTNSIPCLFDYFDESWSHPLYSDRFWKLYDNMMCKLKHNDKNIRKFLGDNVAALASIYNANTMTELSKLAGLDERFDQIYAEKLQNVLTKFIDDNIEDFPAFSHVRDAVNRMNSNDNN